MRNLRFSLALMLLLGSLSSTVLAQATFGAEFTMTSPSIYNATLIDRTGDDDISSEKGRELLRKFAEVIGKKCGDCSVIEAKDRYDLPIYRVTLPQKFSFALTLDPAVIEVVPDAGTVKDFRNLQAVLESLIFETARELKQRPHVNYGGGHVHIGIHSAFGGNPVLFRNFFVDWLNHPDLMKTFTVDSSNAPTLSDLPVSQTAAMKRVLEDFDGILKKEGFLNGRKDDLRGAQLMEEFARMLQARVYNKTVVRGWTPTEKYQALNVTRLANPEVPWSQKTIELRFFDAQQSVDEFIRLAETFEGRIKFLSARTDLIPHGDPEIYTARETAERLDRYAREASTSASYVRGSIQNRNVRRYVREALMCGKVL